MKKILVGLISAVLVVSLVGCGSGSKVTIENGAFKMSPQQLIDKLNVGAEKNGEGIYPIPKYEASGAPIYVDGDAAITIYVNESDNITRIRWSWYKGTSTKEQLMTMGFYFAATIGTLDPTIETNISEELGITEDRYSDVKTEYRENNLYFYMVVLDGKVHVFVEPEGTER